QKWQNSTPSDPHRSTLPATLATSPERRSDVPQRTKSRAPRPTPNSHANTNKCPRTQLRVTYSTRALGPRVPTAPLNLHDLRARAGAGPLPLGGRPGEGWSNVTDARQRRSTHIPPEPP